MKNIVVDYKEIVNTIARQFYLVKPEGIKLVIEDEQSWNKEQDRTPETLYIVIHFGDTATNFGQAVVPITMEVMGLQNEIELTQGMLNQYVTEYNRLQDGDITQLYLTPTVNQRFGEVYEGFRCLLSVEGTFLIGNNTIRLETLTYYYEGGQENIDFISYNDASENSLNPQPYPNAIGRTKSYGSFQTFAFSIVTYPDGNKQLIKDIMAMKFDTSKSHQNDTFEFSGTFAHSDINMPKWKFKCRQANFDQKIGDIPVITLGFSL